MPPDLCADVADDVFGNPRRSYPEYPHGAVVEIRVHGVGGEPPSKMARDPHPLLVKGTLLAGFFRARRPVVACCDLNGDQRVHVREVLAWGGQTSGTIRHAFWILLAPFALFNVAGRMHVANDERRAAVHRAVCRVLALTMTLSVVAIMCGIAFDLLAVQCGLLGDPCLGGPADRRGPVAPLRFFGGDTIGQLGIAALLPVLVVMGLWYAGRYGATTLEAHAPTMTPAEERQGGEPVHLADARFWRNAWPTSRLRALHASAGFAWIGMTLALCLVALVDTSWYVWPLVAAVQALVVAIAMGLSCVPGVASPGRSRQLHAVLALIRFVSLGLLVTTVGAATLRNQVTELSAAPGLPDSTVAGAILVAGGVAIVWWAWGAFRLGDRRTPDVGIVANLFLAGGALVVGWAVSQLWPDLVALSSPSVPELGAVDFRWVPGWVGDLFPGLFAPPYIGLVVLVGVQLLLLVALVVAAFDTKVAGKKRPDASQLDDGSPVFANLSAVVVAVLSLLLLTAVGAALHALTLDWLGDRVPGSAAQPPVAVPLVLPWWHTLIAVVVALLIPFIGGVVWVVFARRRVAPSPAQVRQHLLGGYPDPRVPDEDTDTERLQTIAKLWTTQRLLRDGGQMLLWIVGTASVAIAVIATLLVTTRNVGDDLWLTTTAVFIVSLIPIGGVTLIRSSLRDPEARRKAGAAWDVLTFWPRVTHPFAPPCYGEALVPMLEEHIDFLLDPPPDGDGPRAYRVLLAGHSQGSMIALATLARLDPDTRAAIGFVTYGSPISILYERYYRGTFQTTTDPNIIDTVATARSWHHLFAMTEPFAFPFWPVQEAPDCPPDHWAGWRVTRLLPQVRGVECPACDANAAPRRADLLVRDPEWWTFGGTGPTTPTGHSAYHNHQDVDDHIRTVACDLAVTIPAAAPR